MKNIYEVLRHKEQQSEQLQKEIEALRLAINILEAHDNQPAASRPESRSNGNGVHEVASSVAVANAAKRFP